MLGTMAQMPEKQSWVLVKGQEDRFYLDDSRKGRETRWEVSSTPQEKTCGRHFKSWGVLERGTKGDCSV